ncbi:MAG: hypothetical protein SFW35_08645 [Chitinophagales bacterium]|nr:hypothetical protein [Chitinophagales bacterium]
MKGIKILALIAIAIGAIGFVTMSLWNWLIPSIFNGPAINFVQALGLLLLSKLLVGFGHFGHRHHNGFRERIKASWRARWEEKLASMSPEEREKIKEKCFYKYRFSEEGENAATDIR